MTQQEPGRILAVDDEQSLLTVMTQYLRRIGHDVVPCRNGQEALAAFESEPESFRFVVADLTLPEMAGSELLLKFLHLNPRVSILICSGYPFDPSTLPPAHREQIGFLQKPFTPKMLAEALEHLRSGQDEPPA